MKVPFVRRAASALIGEITWQPPGWLRSLRAHRAATDLCLLLALAAALGGYHLYTHRHHPTPAAANSPRNPHAARFVTARISPPGVPAVSDKPTIPSLTIHFDNSAAALPLLTAKSLPASLVRLEPSQPGAWQWDGDRTLVFKPTQDWPAAQTYRVTVDPAALGPDIRLTDYHFETRTPDFTGSLTHVEFYQNPKDPAVKQVTATLVFTHAVDPAELERRVSVKMLGDSSVYGSPTPAKLFSLRPGRQNREFFLRTVPLTLPAREDTMKLLIADDLPAARGHAHLAEARSATVRIPDLFSFFRITETTTSIVKDKDGNPEQFLFVETSCPARSEDLAKSLELYALPRVNPAAHKDKDKDKNADADNDADADKSDTTATDPDADAATDRDHDDPPPGNHDGRFHDDGDEGEGHTDEGVEKAELVDAPDPIDDWSTDDVGPTALKRSRRLTPTLVPSHDDTATTHTFRLRDDTPGHLFVKIRKDVPAPGGFRLRNNYENVLDVPVPTKDITVQGDGGILALSGEKKLAVTSRGVPAIRYEIARVPAAQINHLASQTEGNFQNPDFLSHHFNEQDLARITAETQPINLRNPVEANYSTFDFTAHLGPVAADGLDREGLFFLTASGWDPKTNKYLKDVSDKRFVLVTDLGLIVKRNTDGSQDAFVASLSTGQPVSGVDIAVLARSGATLASAATDPAGRATLPNLGKNPRDSREPVAIVARRGGDVSFMPYNRSDRALDFSRFPTEGVEARSAHDLEAFVFTERGVYRPGDTLHVGVIVKQRDWTGAPTGLPLETEVVDAGDNSAAVKPLLLPSGGFGEWTFDTTAESPTGAYKLNVYLTKNGKRSTLLGTSTVQVQEFLPDRLKLDTKLSKTSGPSGHGWVTPDELGGSLVLQNLYGTAASDRLVKAHLRLNPRAFAFKEYPDYTFFDRLHEAKKDWEGETVELGDGKTDAEGKASFDFDLHAFADATYRLTFDAEGFEAEGGRSVEDLSATLVSPLPYVVGWHADGDLSWITAGGPGRTVEFIGVDRALARIPLEKLTLHLAEQQFLSVLTKDNDGNYKYESVRKEKPLHDEPAAIPATGWKYTLPNTTPGSFVAELRDADNNTVSRVEYTVVGKGQVTRSLEKNAELEIKLDKEQYRVGEDIQISVTAPYAGSGLITIEREKVFTHKWFKATGTGSVQTITVPADFDGTGYVNVSFIRALDSREIFMSPLSYAVAPFTANMERRRLAVELHAVDHIKPGSPLAIHYHTDRPARIAVFAVDQGILSVTKFPLPDPLAYHFRKSALGVRTTQIVDLLLPEFSILRAAQSVGGDGDVGELNPFRRVTEKPVVYWSGVVDADTTDRTVTYPVPDYFSGTLTLMAVASAPDAVGNAKATTLCRNAFVLTPAVPTLAAPGDEFEVGLTVANGQIGSGPDARITVSAQPSEGLQILRAPSEPLHIAEGREASTTFRVRALDHLGSATLSFRASNGNEETGSHATLSVRPAMPFRTVVTGGRFRGPSQDVPVSGSTLYPEYRHLDASVSALPLGLARGLERYLKEYPHGCSEQITSGAFARLALAGEADFGLTRAEAATQIEKTINVERRRQNDQGGFGFWENEKTPDIDFITVYVMHFLSEAKKEGYPVPDDLFAKGKEALERAASASPWNLQQARIQAYAIYVLTREGVVTTNHLLTLRDYLDTYYKARWHNDLAGVYLAGSWSLLKKDDEARKLIDGYKMGQYDPREWWDFYQPLCADAQYVTMVARHFPDLLKKLPPGEFDHVLKPIGSGDFSTLSAAYAVLALKAYSQAATHDAPRLRVGALLANATETPLSLDGKNLTLLRGPFPPTATALRFHADGGTATGPGIYYQATQSGFARTPPSAATSSGIEVIRDLLTADGKNPVTRVKLGDRVTVRLRFRATKPNTSITNVAVLDLLPGGFEIADKSLQPGLHTAGMDYVDVREDRNIFYGTVTNTLHEITYRLKPTARGEFVVPPVFAESMYDKKIQSLGTSSHITVLDSK